MADEVHRDVEVLEEPLDEDRLGLSPDLVAEDEIPLVFLVLLSIQEVVDDRDALAGVQGPAPQRKARELGKGLLVLRGEGEVVGEEEGRTGRKGGRVERLSLLVEDDRVRSDLVQPVEDRGKVAGADVDPWRGLHLVLSRVFEGALEEGGCGALVGIQLSQDLPDEADLDPSLEEEGHLDVAAKVVRQEERGSDASAKDVHPPGAPAEVIQGELRVRRRLVGQDHEPPHGASLLAVRFAGYPTGGIGVKRGGDLLPLGEGREGWGKRRGDARVLERRGRWPYETRIASVVKGSRT